ncbi:hypothetical protein ACFYOD_06500 [Streptomyces sp. NPDC006703]|uniref:hypothetical protein n=1 Tax=Streptomyces sp. NPDC006703 TaxID=3364759 RepID=UPI0036A04640
MTLSPAPLLTNGATHSAQSFRMMIRDLAGGSEGVTQGGDLKVAPLAVPAGGVQIGDGSAIIQGRASPSQGHYTAYNIGSETLRIAPAASLLRCDLVVLRVQDPQYEGSRDPAKDPVVFFDVIPNVSLTQTELPPGYSGIPLARIMMPINTGTVTASMITDLRQVANPRRDRQIYTASPVGDQDWPGNEKGQWVAWPPVARWNIKVPPWAVSMRAVMTIAGVQVMKGSVWGGSGFQLGAAQGQSVWFETGSASRIHMISADTVEIPAAMRGTTQPLQAMVSLDQNNAGVLQADIATTAIADIEFEEGTY